MFNIINWFHFSKLHYNIAFLFTLYYLKVSFFDITEVLLVLSEKQCTAFMLTYFGIIVFSVYCMGPVMMDCFVGKPVHLIWSRFCSVTLILLKYPSLKTYLF